MCPGPLVLATINFSDPPCVVVVLPNDHLTPHSRPQPRRLCTLAHFRQSLALPLVFTLPSRTFTLFFSTAIKSKFIPCNPPLPSILPSMMLLKGRGCVTFHLDLLPRSLCPSLNPSSSAGLSLLAWVRGMRTPGRILAALLFLLPFLLFPRLCPLPTP